jgi:hypothetical protein
VVPAGRRSYKTEIAKRKVVLRALLNQEYGAWYAFTAPTQDQAKRIFWTDLKQLIPWQDQARRSETELLIELWNGARVSVEGLDKPERIEGSMLHGIVMDEYANMKPSSWTEHVRPALADTGGFCYFLGVPEGRNHYYDLYQHALADDSGTWATFHWYSDMVVAPEEIAEARATLDEVTYRQEFQAEFLSFQGSAYYAYNLTRNVGSYPYNPALPLIICFDFNVAPGVASIAQEHLDINETWLVDEVHIDRNSNTLKVCNEILRRYEHTHKARVAVYGDATGGAKGTAKVMGSDWDLIRGVFSGSEWGGQVTYRVPRQNPPERARVNAMNSRLCSVDLKPHMRIDRRCKHTIKDFEGVASKDTGEIDKKSDPTLTHLTDAVGYYVAYEFPIRRTAVGSSKIL